MVIANSDSCGTLVSLEPGGKHESLTFWDEGATRPEDELETIYFRTSLCLPLLEDDLHDDDPENQVWSHQPVVQQQLCLPLSEAVDLACQRVPQLAETCDQILSGGVQSFGPSSNQRILYVSQGEVAHATAKQCDVILSDRATTCHILALRSTFGDVSMTSLAHLDDPTYDACIRQMVMEHERYHEEIEPRCQQATCTLSDNRIQMDLHLLGGYENEDARALSNHLVCLLGAISNEVVDMIKMTFRTCAISAMNDDGLECPIGRGLGLDMKTGRAFLAKMDGTVPMGPLRSARLWQTRDMLSVIHTCHSDLLVVEPFQYEAIREMDVLLNLDNETLLQFTSTSPDVEDSEDFCSSVRATLRFMKQIPSSKAFPNERPILLERMGKRDIWGVFHESKK